MAEIQKLYNIKLTGEKDLALKMEAVNRSFDAAKKNFLDLKATLAKGGLSTDEMKNIKVATELARLETIKLNQERIRLTNDGRALSNSLKQERADRAANNQSLAQNTNEYKELAKNLNILRNDAKALGAEFGIESDIFIQAAKKANVLDKEIKAIDAAVGQFQRNVGNYPKEINIGKISTGAFDSLKNAGLGNLLGNQIDQTKGKVVQLNTEFAEMKTKLDSAKASGVTDLNAIETEIIQNRIEADKLNVEIKESQTHLAGMGSVGTGVFSDFKSNISQVILGYVGLQAAMSTVTELVRGSKDLSDQTTNLEIELGKTAGGAGKLVDQLAKLDTRTKLAVLEDMANIAAKAGVSEENLVGVTQAIDKIKIAFGKDFGDVEQGTESLVKIINIFEGADQVNGENLLKTGNALRTLANESVASVPFITDFTKRMAGLKGIADISLPSVLGLASGFEQFGQTSETSSTALVKIIPKIAKDVDKFAKIAGVTNAEFKKMINENPAEALIKVSEGLVKNKNGITDISNSFADSELGSGRIASVLGVLGKNADTFRKSIDSAGKAYQNTSNIEDAFKAKNENLASVYDKLSKKVSDLANNKTFINTISITGSAILGLIGIIGSIPFGVYIGVLAFLTLAYWNNVVAIYASITATRAKIATQLQYIVLQATGNALIILGTALEYAQAIATGTLTAAKWLLIASMNALGISTAVVEAAYIALNATFLALPIGWIVAGILAVGVITTAYGNQVENTTKKLKAHGEAALVTAAQIRVGAEIEKRATEATADRIAKLQVLTQIATDLNNSDASRKKALEELITVDEKYKTALDGNIIKTDKLRQITDGLTASILNQAKAEAAKGLLVEKQKQIIDNEFKKGGLQIRAKKQENDGVFNRDRALFEEKASSQIEGINEENKRLKEDVNALASLVAKDVTKNPKGSITGGTTSTTGTGEDPDASKLTGGQKDYLRDINAMREANLSELKKSRLQGVITEEEFLKKSLAVNIKYNDQILAHFKGSDAITRKLRADTASDSIDKRIETNAKLFKIQEDELKQSLENEKAFAQAKLDNVNNDPGATNLDKAEAEKVFYEEILNSQVAFNTQMSALENALKIESKKNSDDRKNLLIKNQTDLNTKIIQLSKAQFESVIAGIEDFKTYQKNNAEIEASKRRMLILNDKNLSQKEKEHELEKINAALSLANTNIDLGAVNARIKQYDDIIAKQKLANDEQKIYNDLLRQKQLLEEGKAVGEKEVKIKGTVELELPSSETIQNKIKALFTDKDGKFIVGIDAQGNEIDGAPLLGEAIAQSFDLANQAMSSYFEGERQQVEQSKQLAYQRIDLEKKQLLARAQSTAERESIEKRAQIKKDKADKEAHEKMKKIKKSEITIAFALQLANIAVAAASNPANGVTFGAAGIVMYGILAAIATAGYIMNMANVNKQQFARGGNLPTRGGRFIGNSHADGGIPVGMNEFEGEELAIINKNSAQSNKVYSVTGTPKQIASGINEIGGGVSFASGAIFKKYANGGYFGSSVQPPVFRSYYENRTSQNNDSNNGSSERLDRIEQMLEHTNNTLSREVHRKTIVSSKDMTSVQGNDYKQSEIGTL